MQRQNPVRSPAAELSAEHVALKGRLKNVQSPDFDRLYLSEQVRDSPRGGRLFQREVSRAVVTPSEAGSPPPALPTLRQH